MTPTGMIARRKRFIHRIAWAWLLLLIIGSLQPKHPPSWAALHRQMHWLVFAGLTMLLIFIARSLLDAIWRSMGSVLLGVTLECLQHLIYHTEFEWRDAGDDTLATVVAFTVYWFFLRQHLPNCTIPVKTLTRFSRSND